MTSLFDGPAEVAVVDDVGEAVFDRLRCQFSCQSPSSNGIDLFFESEIPDKARVDFRIVGGTAEVGQAITPFGVVLAFRGSDTIGTMGKALYKAFKFFCVNLFH